MDSFDFIASLYEMKLLMDYLDKRKAQVFGPLQVHWQILCISAQWQ